MDGIVVEKRHNREKGVSRLRFTRFKKRYNRLLGGTILSDHLNDSVKRWCFELDIR